MKNVLRTAVGFVVLMWVMPASAQTAAPPPAVDVTAADILATLKTAPPGAVADLAIRVANAGSYNVGVYVVTRPKSAKQASIYHETKVSETYYMLEGAGTLVTGGTLVGPVVKEAPGTSVLSVFNNVRGTAIEGGVSRRIAKGDVVVIPGYLPHWWSNIESDMTYLVIRPDPDKTMPLK